MMRIIRVKWRWRWQTRQEWVHTIDGCINNLHQSSSALSCSLNYKCELDLKKVSKKIMREKEGQRERKCVRIEKGNGKGEEAAVQLNGKSYKLFFNFFGPKAYDVSKTPRQAGSNEVLPLTQRVTHHVTNQTKPPLLSSSLLFSSLN